MSVRLVEVEFVVEVVDSVVATVETLGVSRDVVVAEIGVVCATAVSASSVSPRCWCRRLCPALLLRRCRRRRATRVH